MPIENFENITEELTLQDQSIAIKICKALIDRKSQGEYSNASIRRALHKQGVASLGGPKLRAMVHFMREADIPLREFEVNGYIIATGKGYRFSQIPEEIKSHILSMDQRMRSMYVVRRCAHKKYLAMTGTQIKMEL